MDTNTIIAIAIVAGALLIFALKDYWSEINIPTPWGNLGLKLRDKLDKNPDVFKNAGINVQYNASDYTSGTERSNISNRDAVINELASLVQIIKALAIANKIPFAESADVLLIVDRLIAGNVLTAELAGAVRFLYGLGKEVRDKPNDKIDSVFSKKYGFIVNQVVEVINKLLVPATGTIEPPPPRKTQVGGAMIGFAHPEPGRPAATLHCLAGALQGQRFPIDKPVYRLGANARNDLVISGDDYVSGSHAYISYDQGSLRLFDDGSRNGTFLNGDRLKSPMLLKLGDKIRLGGCTFELT